jgi:hypothetical protein
MTEDVVSKGATLAATPSEIRFDPKGATLTGAGKINVTLSGAPSWQVDVNASGRVRAKNCSEELCT